MTNAKALYQGLLSLLDRGQWQNQRHLKTVVNRYVLEIETDPGAGLRGLQVHHDKHLYGEITCHCGHINRREPGRCPADLLWTVELSEWHLVGPLLVSLLVCLSHRMHLSRRRIQEFLRDWLGIELSTSTINQCLHEAGRAVEPIEE
jgi:transposase